MKTLWKEKWILLFIFVSYTFYVGFSAVVAGENNKQGRQLDGNDEHLANETDSEEVLNELKKEQKPEAMADSGDGPTTASGFNEFASSDQSAEVPSKEADHSQDSNKLNKLSSGDTQDNSSSSKASSNSAEKVENNTGPDNNLMSENSDSKEPSNVDQFSSGDSIDNIESENSVSKDSSDVNKLSSGDSSDNSIKNKASSSDDEKVDNNSDKENTGLDDSNSQSSHEKNTGPDNNLTSESSDFDGTKFISTASGDNSKVSSSSAENVENNTDEENTGLDNSASQSSNDKNNISNSSDSGTDSENNRTLESFEIYTSNAHRPFSASSFELITTEWETEENFKISDKLKIWPRATIPFFIDDVSFAPAFRNKIREYLDSINSMTGVNFFEVSVIPKSMSYRYIFFLNRREILQCQDYTSDSFSNRGSQAVILGYNSFDSPGCMNALVLAILGVPPQHNAPDRENYITVNYRNILPEYKKFYRKVEFEWPFRRIPYDFESASHYGPFKFTRNGGATIQFNKVTPKQSGSLTRSDLEKISFLYQNEKKDAVKGVPPVCNDLFKTVSPEH